MSRCNKCGRKITEAACAYCPDPAQRLMELQAKVKVARPTKRVRSSWWTSKWKPGCKPIAGQDAALPVGDR